MDHAAEADLPHLEAEVEVAMMTHHHHTTMVPLQGRQHEAAMPRHEAVE
jgi:hypothetical protein